MSLYATPQFDVMDTIAVSSSLTWPGTSFTLTAGSFGTVTGTAILVIDYLIPGNATYVACTISGATVSGISYLGGNTSSSLTHGAGTPVTMSFTPAQYNSLVDFSGTNANLPYTSFTPTLTGFSASPTFTSFYTQIGKTVFYNLYSSVNGTSNASTLTVTLPVAAKHSQLLPGGIYVDGGTVSSTGPCQVSLTASSTTAAICKSDGNNASWSNTGGKSFSFNITYESV